MKTAILSLAIYLSIATACAFTSEDILKVEPGMNIKQVEAILGSPKIFGGDAAKRAFGLQAGRVADENLTTWEYRDKAAKRSVLVTYRSSGVLKAQSSFRVVDVSAWVECVTEVVARAPIKIGATSEQTKAALGEAYRHFKVSQTLTADGTSEQWTSSDDRICFSFEKDALVSFRH